MVVRFKKLVVKINYRLKILDNVRSNDDSYAYHVSPYDDLKRCVLSTFLKDSRLDAVLICAGNEFHVLGPANENDEFFTSVSLEIDGSM